MRITTYLFLTAISSIELMGVTSEIDSPQKRMMTVDTARILLTSRPVEDSGEDILKKDPFNPPRDVIAQEIETPVGKAALGDREVLMSLSREVTPSGTMKLGDTQILLFGQKKLKVGDSVSIVFQGVPYEIQISGIERTSYTLRLNREEITRPIKPVNKP